MNKKGVFPYSWAQSAACYNLPYLVEKEHFFNTLTQSHITDEDYNIAKQVWKTFEMRTMKDYCRMYCLTGKLISYAFSFYSKKNIIMPEKLIPFLDALILAEIFEAFRYECMANFELEPAHFLSLPSFAYQVYNNSIIICTNKASDSFSFFYFN